MVNYNRRLIKVTFNVEIILPQILLKINSKNMSQIIRMFVSPKIELLENHEFHDTHISYTHIFYKILF